jgi:hypothetical protein
MGRYIVIVKTVRGKIIKREGFSGYDQAMEALDRCQVDFPGHHVEFRDSDPFDRRH